MIELLTSATTWKIIGGLGLVSSVILGVRWMKNSISEWIKEKQEDDAHEHKVEKLKEQRDISSRITSVDDADAFWMRDGK